MFCTKCGSKLEEGSKFCISCGAAIENNEVNNNNNVNNSVNNNPVVPNMAAANGQTTNIDFKDIASKTLRDGLEIIKSPLSAVKELKFKDKEGYFGITIIAILISVINFFLFKSALFKGLGGAFLNTVVNRMLSSSTIAMIVSIVILNVVIVAASTGVLFLINNKMAKNSEFTIIDSLKVIISGYTYSTILLFGATIISYIYMPCSLLIAILAMISNAVIIFAALNEYNGEASTKNLYTVMAVNAVVVIIYFVFTYLKIQSIVSNMGSLLDTGSIFNSLF